MAIFNNVASEWITFRYTSLSWVALISFLFFLNFFLGLLSVLKQLSFEFYLFIFYDILQTINILSKKLQL